MPLLTSKREKNEQNRRDTNPESLLAVSIPDPTGLTRADPTHWNQLWDSFDRYYADNEKAIMEASKLDVLEIASSKKGVQKDAVVTSFLEHSKTILNGLQFLSEIHPAIAVVVGAFGAVIKIELIRRDNNMKAMGVKIQMQNLMCALFQLRLLRTEEHDYMTSQRVAHMMSMIAEEIKACGSDLSYYQDKKLVSRLLHAQFFEQRLAQHIATFAERRSELELLFTSYTAGQVQETTAIASRIEYKVDNLITLLHRFDSFREKEAAKFVESNGGIERCIYEKALFTELMSKTGDTVREEGDTGQKGEDDPTVTFMKQLQKELREDVEEALNKNMANFEAMLRIQNNNLQHMSHLMENQTSQIMKISNEIAIIFPGMRKHVLITDPILQQIWMEMGLRQSVKAKKFVLTFKDYHTRMTRTPMIMAASPVATIPILELPPAANLDTTLPEEKPTFITGGAQGVKEEADDDWALHYIDVVHLDPIVEAIDDDFSGFISIHEANRFAVARPKTWSLLRWFAYWAAGWAMSVKKYKEKILDVVQQLYIARLDVLPCNMAFITDYLDSSAFKSLDTLLRSTQPLVGDYDSTDAKLASLMTEFDEELEGRLLANLTDLKFNLASVDKVTLVTGPGRIERFALPLIYLLLKHHLSVVRLSSHYRFCSQEMTPVSTSLLMILNSLRSRAEKLEAVFRQKSRPIQDQFKKFSFGMLELFNSPAEYQDINNALLKPYWEKNGNTATSADDETPNPPSTASPSTVDENATKNKSLLTEADREAFEMLSEKLDHAEDQPVLLEQLLIHDYAPPSSTEGSQASNIAGAWTARAHRDRGLSGKQRDLVLLNFNDPGPNGTELTGDAVGFTGPGKISGTIERKAVPVGEGNERPEGEQHSDAGNSNEIVALDFTRTFPEGSVISHYRVTPVAGSDGMQWTGEWWFDDYEADKGVRPFDMFRAPPEALRYRHILEDTPLAEEEHANGPTDETQPSDGDPAAQNAELDQAASGPALPAEASSESASDPPPENEKPNSGALALKRWRFAKEVVLYQVRQKLHSTSFYRERAKERKRYVLITMKLAHSEQSDDEFSELLDIRAKVNPNICYVWKRIAAFYDSDRKVAEHVTSYVWCDSCADRFCFTRNFCITCQLPSLNNQIDICSLCINKNIPITTTQFTHDLSHTLFKSNRRILHMERPHLIPQARVRAKRVKEVFRGDDTDTRHHGKATVTPRGPAPKCIHCEEEISLPCWVCTVCPQDTYICMDCEKKLEHEQYHGLLRIFNDVEEEDSETTTEAERYYNRAKTALAEELEGLETKFNERMEALAAEVGKIQQAVLTGPPLPAEVEPAPTPKEERAQKDSDGDLVSVSHRIDKLEKDVASRFTSLEGMLLKVLEAVEARR
ncbi:hypothetical protein NMY22_g10101 [Coprinellus aureogranulatus]|nr:hypothetical protein NMY22_g10101 [Coprinellus aureogranulatus]